MIRRLLTLGIVLLLTQSLMAQSRYHAESGVAAFEGYDLVSYFNSPVPLKGVEEHSYEYDGVKLLFSSVDNLEHFMSDPEKYLPAYGGWCATAMVNNNFVIPNYTMFKIQDGELLFFQVKAFFNARTHWEKEPEVNKEEADKSYQGAFGE